jgi:hypothetical protein
MTLRQTLQQMISEGTSTKLTKGNDILEPDVLLATLSEPLLERHVYMQPGLYIAEINEGGYLGRVLFRFARDN